MSFETNFNDVVSNIEKDTSISEADKTKFLQNINRLKNTKLNLMIVGGTGVGKSSTINALFGMEKAKIGTSSNPETMSITSYELGNVILWDSLGLGDGKEADERHAKAIISKLTEKDSKGELLIDMVLVILDGGSRDLGTSYELINSVIIPNLGNDKSRLLVAINKADNAMSGRYSDFEKSEPQPKLIDFLDEKVNSTKSRIKEATGVDIDVIYYSAGYTDDDTQEQPYNLSKLLAFILRHTKSTKRVVIATQLNQDAKMWEKSDSLKDYQKEVDDSIWNSLKEVVSEGVDFAKEILFNRIDDLKDVVDVTIKTGGLIIKGAKKIGKWLGL
ncbi:50S ribosome-binding GTPase [Moraxella bovis]|uniref:50S ribosome-binding GTPase n=1 Tax=Moraxella bovis TaxID=476 RepID=A0AAQ2Q8K2_MORBO|nr:GTPase [Moraxella bovis]AWY21283.1 GTP-binding protein [Moraxella bovis]OOR88338.1 GTP-binding protein [Moraxella bovis]UYZ75470.1 50S ribosome-binding GTPase [Moraxella bovis]UYZ78588.1 50S ribosome-binding GTPase [Moraxella bovis]UYZ81478.1 50S ribosome-binding GTPase [Moraxella bovis]